MHPLAFRGSGPFWKPLPASDPAPDPAGSAPQGPAPLTALAALATLAPDGAPLGERDALVRDDALAALAPAAARRLPAALQGRLLAGCPAALTRALPPSPWAAGLPPAPRGRATFEAARDALAHMSTVAALLALAPPARGPGRAAEAALCGRASEYVLLLQDWVRSGPRVAADGPCGDDLRAPTARAVAAARALHWVADDCGAALALPLRSAAEGLTAVHCLVGGGGTRPWPGR